MTISDLIAIGNVIATVGAIVAAPIIALRVSTKLQQRADANAAKVELFSTLVSLRHDAFNPEFVKALNKIDIVFVDDSAVREAWSRYYVVLNDANLNNPAGWAFRDDRKRELLLAIVNSLNLRHRISTADILRTYTPQFVGDAQMAVLYKRLLDLYNYQLELNRLNIPHPAMPVGGVNVPQVPPGVPPAPAVRPMPVPPPEPPPAPPPVPG